MDLLHQVLASLRIHDSSLGLMDLQRPWGFHRATMQAEMMVVFSPSRGSCLIRMQDGHQERLEVDDAALVLSGS